MMMLNTMFSSFNKKKKMNYNIDMLASRASDAYQTLPCSSTQEKNIINKNMFVRITYHENKLVVAFRGTDDYKDWFYNMSRWRRKFLDGKVKGHSGFLNYMEQLYPTIVETIFEMCNNNVKQIHVTGHSLGSAVGLLFGARVAYMFPYIHVNVVTFGAPRAGDRKLKTWCDNQSNFTCTRVYNPKDIVTKLPYFGYVHIGHPIPIHTPFLSSCCITTVHSMDTYVIAL